MSILKRMRILEILTLSFFALDRISKVWALTFSTTKPLFVVSGTSFVNWSWMPDLYFNLVFNKGVSWGIFNNGSNVLFMLVSFMVCAVTLWLLRYIIYKYKAGLSIFPESLVLLGSLSNIFDRFMYGGVIDFILVDFHSWTFPVFNLADCAIVFGVFLMFMNLMLDNHPEHINA